MEEARRKAARESTGGQAVAVILLLFVVALPVVYVLALGPVVWYVERTGKEPGIWAVIYAPLEWLSSQSDFVRKALQWYVELWR